MRRRWVYVKNPDTGQVEAVEVTPDWSPTPAVNTTLITGNCHADTRATDGTDISSRAKRREYMARNNLAEADDFTNHWAKANARREAERNGHGDYREIADLVGQTAYDLQQQKRRRR